MCVTRRPSKVRVTELLFADDAAAVGTSRESMEYAAVELEKIVRAWGLPLSMGKTKLVAAGAPSSVEDLRPLTLEGGEIECVRDFKYLGSIVEEKGCSSLETLPDYLQYYLNHFIYIH